MDQLSNPLLTTPLDALHRALGARMVPFAGYAMPVQYPSGVLAEHRHCRAAAALFDVSHMGQLSLAGDGADAALERLVPGDITGLAQGQQRYTLLLDDRGGILDDLMVARVGPSLRLVVNAARKQADIAHLRAALPPDVRLTVHDDRALLAVQGPRAAAVVGALAPAAAALPFMTVADLDLAGVPCWISRSGYTGEDGFEISVPADRAEALARTLLAHPDMAPAGLGARDSLRLEAGLCLYGQDIDTTTTPIEAGLAWTIARRRRAAWDFAGGAVLRAQQEDGPPRRRVGLRVEDRAPARAGTPILPADGAGAAFGHVTSGLFAPNLGAPVAMGFVPPAFAAPGTRLALSVRGRALPATVTALPFVPHRYPR